MLRTQTIFWALISTIVLLLFWVLQDVLMPFILGLAIAYFLDPLVDRLEKLKLPRFIATSFVLLSFIFTFLCICLFLGPILKDQFLRFVQNLPTYMDQMRVTLNILVQEYGQTILNEQDLKALSQDYQPQLMEWATGMLKTIWDGGLAFFDVLSVLIITPVVSFYLLRDWDELVAKVDGWLPKKSQKTIRRLCLEIDETLAGFIRGQSSLCLLMGVLYSVALSCVGLNYAIFIGLFVGFVSFIPYVGAILGFAIGLGVAWFQFDTHTPILIVGGIFVIGQFIEGNILTPRLVGEKIGLHAVWVMFALMAGGSLMGFVGIMIAVPVTAVIGVMVRFFLEQYLKSPYYKGGKKIPSAASLKKKAKKTKARKKA